MEGTKSESEDSNRWWASASFVGVLIVIGVPLWWKTTEVYRVALPYDKISELSSAALTISAQLTILADDGETSEQLAKFIEKSFENGIISLKINQQILDEDSYRKIHSATDELDALEVVADTRSVDEYNNVYLVQKRTMSQEVWMATERVVFFRDLQALNTIKAVLGKWVYQREVLVGAVATNDADSSRRTRFPSGAAYHIVLSVVHPKPEFLQVDFDAGDAVEDYIGSFVDELSVLHNFTLKSQWLHLLEFDFQTRQVKDKSEWGRHFAVKSDMLPQLVTKLESRVATHVSQHPTVNLAFYAQPCKVAPLRFYKNDKPVSAPTQAFMSAKWGGVIIGNPTYEECRDELEGRGRVSRHKPNVRIVMGTFLSQLRELLGIVKAEEIPGAVLEPLKTVSPRRWEIDNLLRIRTVNQITSARLTLTSLAQLLGEISNIVINDDVGASIKSAVEHIELATQLLAAGNLVEAYRKSQSAYLAAEAAFMDPSLLALLYFPDDQKYAIYIPLFLPVMVPVVLSLKNLGFWFKSPSTKQKTD